MKRLWCALITRGDGGWWRMNTSEGDPPVERSFLYRFNVLLEQLHRLMENTDDASDSPRSPSGDARKD